MAGKKDDGGPAFPDSLTHGMTLRDWFAGQALAGLANRESDFINRAQFVAEDCYRLADALLAVRER